MIRLSDRFTFRTLLRFTLPTIVMMVFSSLYVIVDGFFVSNYASKAAFTAVNFIMPYLMILGSVGFMFGTGGGALIAKEIGEGNVAKAREHFTLIVTTSVVCSLILTAGGIALLRPVASAMGATGELLELCVLYGTIFLAGLPFYILQYEFQCLLVTAERPRLGLVITVAAGVTNMVLDWLLVGVFPLGVAGAAAATVAGQIIGGGLPLLFFARNRTSPLRFVCFRFDGTALFRTCTNGSSEFMSQVAMSLVGFLYNVRLLAVAGEDGVAAYGVLMYVSMVFQAIFIGYAVGSAPIVSFRHGAGNRRELRGVFRRSLVIIGVTACLMLAAGEWLSAPFSRLFTAGDEGLYGMTVHAFRIFSLSFLFSGFAIYASSFFTALNDGLTSALISFLRTLVCQVAAVLLLPLAFGLDGIWMSTVAAEIAAVLISVPFLIAKRKRYGY